MEGKFQLEIKYCVAWGYFPQASWIGAEFNREFGADVAITLTPAGQGRLEVYIDGQLIFDRKVAGHYPSYPDVTQMKMDAKEQIPAIVG